MYPQGKQFESLARRLRVVVPLVFALSVAVLTASPALASPADDQYAVAAGHYNAGRWSEASDEFRIFLQRFPEDARTVDATFFQGEALVQLGRYADAGPCFSEVLRRQPNHRHAKQALFRAGETAWLSGRRDTARRELERFVDQYPRDPLGAFAIPYLGQLTLAAGDVARAQQYFAAALTAFPNGQLVDDCRFGMARTLEMSGEPHEAERFYRLLAGTRGSLADDAQLRLGILSREQQKPADAEEFLSAFENNNGPLAESKLRTLALYWLGVVRIERGRVEQAVAALDLAVHLDREHELAVPIEYTAANALRAEHSSEAAARFGRIHETHAEHDLADDALLAQLEILADAAAKQVVAAEQDADTQAGAVQRLLDRFAAEFAGSPLLPLAHQTEGRWRLSRGEYDLAAEVFERLTSEQQEELTLNGAEPGRLGAPVPLSDDTPPGPQPRTEANAAVLREGNWYYLGLARIGQKRFEEALAALEHVNGDAPASIRDGASVARASALVALNRHEDALPELRDYLQSQPDGPDASHCWAKLAVSLAKVGRLSDAEEAFNELSRRNAPAELVLPAALYIAETAYRADKRELARRLFSLLAQDGNPEEFVEKGRSGLAWVEFDSDPKASAERFQKLILEHPGTYREAEAALMRARALEKIDKPQAALEMYNLVIEKHADSPLLADALLGKAKLLDAQQLDAEAADLLEQFVAKFPNSGQVDAALYLWAWTLEDLDRSDDADARFARIADDHPNSLYWGDAVYRLAERAARKEDYARAAELVDRLAASNLAGQVMEHALYLKGQIAAAEENWADVEPPLKSLLEKYPETTLRLPAEYWIAEATYRQGEFDRAGRLFAQLLVTTFDRRDAWLGMVPLRLAQVKAHQRDWDGAYELALGIQQKYPEFKQQYEVDYLLGRCLQSKSDFNFDAARAAYARVVQSKTGSRTETAAMAQWMIGETYFLQKNYEQAVRAYYRVEQLFAFPRWQGLALLQAGKCYEVQGQLERAIETYEQLIQRYAKTTAAEEATRRLRVVRERHALLPPPYRN